MQIEIGSKYIRTGSNTEKGTVVDLNEKFKHAILSMGDGQKKAVPYGTLTNEKYWTKLDENGEIPETEEIKETEETEETEKIEEVPEEVKDKPVKEKKPAKPSLPPTEGIGKDIKDYIVAEAVKFGAVANESNRFISLKYHDRMFLAIFSYGKKSLTLGVRSGAIEGLDIKPSSVSKHMMDYRFKFNQLTDVEKKTISSIVESSLKYLIAKNNKEDE